MLDTDWEWIPYNSPSGSPVELLADGAFRLEGLDRTFTQEEAVSTETPILKAFKTAGKGKVLSVVFEHGSALVSIELRFDRGAGDVPRWHRKLVRVRGAIPSASPHADGDGRLWVSQIKGEPLFKLLFVAFLFWYLVGYHQTFKGAPQEARYSQLRRNPDGSLRVRLPPTHPHEERKEPEEDEATPPEEAETQK